MKHDETGADPSAIRQAVREAYGRRTEGGCCGSSSSSPEAGSSSEEHARRIGYGADELQSVPEGANLGLGCGAPLRGAEVQPGETVLDLGSGAGFDAFIAARDVGPSGRVIGIDMTPEMVGKARANAARAGITNVEFRLGLIESLPLADDSVDLVVSNCVINLSPDKPAVFREAFRVLRPGGRMAVSDIVLTAPLPDAVRSSLEAYVGCVAGAALLDDYLQMIRDAGFAGDLEISTAPADEALSSDDPIVRAAREFVLEEGGGCCSSTEDLADVAETVLSAKILARKPAATTSADRGAD